MGKKHGLGRKRTRPVGKPVPDDETLITQAILLGGVFEFRVPTSSYSQITKRWACRDGAENTHVRQNHMWSSKRKAAKAFIKYKMRQHARESKANGR